MDLNAFDFDLDADLDPDSDSARPTAPSETGRPARSLALARAALKRQSAAAPTNSPGCTPALGSNETQRGPRPIRSVRTDAWSVPASVSWARPSRALRKVARRALETDGDELA